MFFQKGNRVRMDDFSQINLHISSIQSDPRKNFTSENAEIAEVSADSKGSRLSPGSPE
jgi:hypothetical protein